MTVALIPQIKFRWFDANGNPLAGGQVFTYSAGTTSPLESFADTSGLTQNANPVVLDSAGYAPIYLTVGKKYKIVVKSALGVTIQTVDNVQAFINETTNVTDWGAKGDGVTDDTTAFQTALSSGASEVFVPPGRFVISQTLTLAPGVSLIGAGIDYWDTFRPDPTNLPKSDSKGTHLYFTGTGPKTSQILNISNERIVKTVGGVNFPLTDFTLNDGVNGLPATPKPFSVAIKVSRNSQLKNLRLLPSFNGISGYLNSSLTTLAADWDIGVWAASASDANIENVQSVGYWRMGSLLVTENVGTFVGKGNSERLRVSKFFGQGRRGLIVRNAPQVEVVSNTSNTITVKYNSSSRFMTAGSFVITGSSQVYTFTNSVYSAPNVVLSGVTPSLPAGVGVIRAPNVGNGFSSTAFNDCVFCSLDHTSGAASHTFDIGEAGAFEFDGYPLRSLSFNNTKFQTTYDRLNGIFGDCRDFKFLNGQFENGALIAYTNSETEGYTSNLQLVNTEIATSVNRTQFSPRDAFISMDQFPTLFTNGTFYIQPWRPVETSIWGQNITLKNMSGQTIMSLFSGSLNVTTANNLTAGGELISTNPTRPAADVSTTCGTSARRWHHVYSENFRPGVGTAIWTSGIGSPEGVVTASIGSMYTRTNGGAGSTLYVKESGSGNTGWVAK